MSLGSLGCSGALVAIMAMAVAVALPAPVHAAPAGDENPWFDRGAPAIPHPGGEEEAPHETVFVQKEAVEAEAAVDATTNSTG